MGTCRQRSSWSVAGDCQRKVTGRVQVGTRYVWSALKQTNRSRSVRVWAWVGKNKKLYWIGLWIGKGPIGWLGETPFVTCVTNGILTSMKCCAIVTGSWPTMMLSASIRPSQAQPASSAFRACRLPSRHSWASEFSFFNGFIGYYLALSTSFTFLR